MKILIIHTFYKQAGGEDTVVYNEMNLLQNHGHEVELLKFKNVGFTFLKLLFLPFNPLTYLRVRKKIKSFQPDILHVHNMHFAASASLIYAANALKVPIVVTLHNYRLLCPSGSLYYDGKIFLESLKPGFPWNAVKKGVYHNSKWLTFWLAMSNYLHAKFNTYQKVNTFITLGDHSRQIFANSYLKNYSHKIVVKPNFSPDQSISTNVNQNYFLFIGRLSQEKGIKTLLKAFSNSDFNLKIVGSGPLEEMVLKATDENQNIKFFGRQNSDKISSFLDYAEALIFPSEWYETFGMVITEAFSKAVPVIASNLGNIKNMVQNGKNGLTFEAGNFRDLKRKVGYFRSISPEEKFQYKNLARAAYQDHYTEAANYSKLIEIYHNAINKHFYHQ